jgi:large-conductance mechanosensitive channel
MENNFIEKTKQMVDVSEDKFNEFIIIIIDFLRNNLVGFLKFLFDKNIIQTGIGIIIATQVSKLTDVFVQSLFNPIINRITVGTVNNINDWQITLFDIKIKIGLIISSIINFLLIALIVYYIWKLSQNNSFDFINEMLADTKESIPKQKTRVIINVATPISA